MTRFGNAPAVFALVLALVPLSASRQSADPVLSAATAYVSTQVNTNEKIAKPPGR
jgi:hypothetical protein